jgi:hypothetical protein
MASRLDFTWAMNAALFADLLERVPRPAYVADRIAAGDRIRFDHGALRTIRFRRARPARCRAGSTPSAAFWNRWAIAWRRSIPFPACA